MKKLSKDEALALSAGWVAVVLNVVPGLGTGYIYQRRWKAYWTTIGISSLWTFFVLFRELGIDPSDPLMSQDDQLGVLGILTLSFLTALEAGIHIRFVRNQFERE